jgi:hypothetical protein
VRPKEEINDDNPGGQQPNNSARKAATEPLGAGRVSLNSQRYVLGL